MQVAQDATNALMARLARRGLHVVRLKGGDPSMFGRVEEERAYLEARGIAVETVAGVTAASAAAAQFAFPLTHRGVARRVLYLTGRTQDGAPALGDTHAVADPETTLVFYMASHVAARIQDGLMRAGRAPATPCLIVENAGSERASTAAGSLATLGADVARAGFAGPVLIVVGPVAAMARVNETLVVARAAG
jgi:uroporphyrin-III C-methyltransferase